MLPRRGTGAAFGSSSHSRILDPVVSTHDFARFVCSRGLVVPVHKYFVYLPRLELITELQKKQVPLQVPLRVEIGLKSGAILI